jgi:hypothetical protein
MDSMKESLSNKTIFIHKSQNDCHLLPLWLILSFINKNAKFGILISLRITCHTLVAKICRFLFEFSVMYFWHSMEHLSRQLQQLYHYKLIKTLSILLGFQLLANSVSKLNWFIQEMKEPSEEEYCWVFLKKRKEPRKKEYCRIFFKKTKELNCENIAEYINRERKDLWCGKYSA